MKKTVAADFTLLLVALTWGTTFVLVQNAINILPPFSFNAFRFLIAGMFLLIWIFIFNRKLLKTIDRKLLVSGVILGGWLFAGYGLQTIGLMYTTSSKSGFITGLSVVLVPVFAFTLLKQKVKPLAIIGIFSAIIGLFFLTNGNSLIYNKGDLFTLFCAVAFALHIVFTAKYTVLFSAMQLTLIQVFTVAALSGLFTVIFEDTNNLLESIMAPVVLYALIITSIVATALSYLTLTAFQKFTSPSHVALILTTEPVFAAITAYLWNNETLSKQALFGCFLILIGMLIAELPEKKT